jgi:hypothetical protein
LFREVPCDLDHGSVTDGLIIESFVESQRNAAEGPNSTPRIDQRAAKEHNPLVRSARNPGSLREAIAAMCAHCMGCTCERIEPGFRDDIRDCTALACPLWHQRPFQRGPKKQKTPAATGATSITTRAGDCNEHSG